MNYLSKSIKKELEGMTNKELQEVLREFPKEQKKLSKQIRFLTKEHELNNHVEFYIKGIFAKRQEDSKV